jgi:hypothetical protein
MSLVVKQGAVWSVQFVAALVVGLPHKDGNEPRILIPRREFFY